MILTRFTSLVKEIVDSTNKASHKQKLWDSVIKTNLEITEKRGNKRDLATSGSVKRRNQYINESTSNGSWIFLSMSIELNLDLWDEWM